MLSAQHVSIGVKLGTVPGDVYTSRLGGHIDESKRYTVGPSLDVELWKGLGVEFDALYRRIGFDASRDYVEAYYARQRGNSWEFPLLAKYRLPVSEVVRPFVGAGFAWRKTTGSGYTQQMVWAHPGDDLSRRPYEADYPTTHGAVVGGGVEFNAKHLRIAPEFRYTHWTKPFHDVHYGSVIEYSEQNQVQILLGISWK